MNFCPSTISCVLLPTPQCQVRILRYGHRPTSIATVPLPVNPHLPVYQCILGRDPRKNKLGCSSSRLGVSIKDSDFTSGVHEETPLVLAVKVSYNYNNKKCSYFISVFRLLLLLWTSTLSWSINRQKKDLAKIQPSSLVNNSYIIIQNVSGFQNLAL